jgi:hypothetical protein
VNANIGVLIAGVDGAAIAIAAVRRTAANASTGTVAVISVGAELTVVARERGAAVPVLTASCAVAVVTGALVPVIAVGRCATDTHAASARVIRGARIQVITRFRVVVVLAAGSGVAPIGRADVPVIAERIIRRMHACIGILIARIDGAAESIAAVPCGPRASTSAVTTVDVRAPQAVVTRVAQGTVRPVATRNRVAPIPRALVAVGAIQGRTTDTRTGSTRVIRGAHTSVVTGRRIERVLAPGRRAAGIVRANVRVVAERIVRRVDARIGVVIARVHGAAEAITAVSCGTYASTSTITRIDVRAPQAVVTWVG